MIAREVNAEAGCMNSNGMPIISEGCTVFQYSMQAPGIQSKTGGSVSCLCMQTAQGGVRQGPALLHLNELQATEQVVFTLASLVLCKHLWKSCIEHHSCVFSYCSVHVQYCTLFCAHTGALSCQYF